MLGAGALVGGWVGPEVTAERSSRAHDVRISAFLLVLEGAQAACNDARAGAGRLCAQRPERPWRQRALGASAPREYVAQAGGDRAPTAEVAKRKRDAGLGLCGEPLLDTGGNDAMSPSGAAASLLAASASMSSDPGVVFGADLAVQLRSLHFQDLGDLNERCPARVGKIEGQQSPIVLALASHGAPNRALRSNESRIGSPVRAHPSG